MSVHQEQKLVVGIIEAMELRGIHLPNTSVRVQTVELSFFKSFDGLSVKGREVTLPCYFQSTGLVLLPSVP